MALDGSRITPEWRRALASAVSRTRRLFDQGRPLCDQTRGRLRYELRATWLGGVRILDRIEASGFDVLSVRPTLGFSDVPGLVASFVSWPLGAGRPRREP
jgi:hypothetical protein